MNRSSKIDRVVFTDVSLNPELSLGLGAFLMLPKSDLAVPVHQMDKTNIIKQIEFREFTQTSSTRLEVQTVLWALKRCCDEISESPVPNVCVYTDSQCVAGLFARRQKLEARNFASAKTGRLLKNTLLYQQFYALHDAYHFDVTKVTGHRRASSRDSVEFLFSLVDQAVRRALKFRVEEMASGL